MPILDRMTQDNSPDDDDQNNSNDEPLFDYPKPEPVQRKRPNPEFLQARLGRRSISLSALVERITDAFVAEHSPDDSAVRAAESRVDRLKLLHPVIDYVMSVESVVADDEEKARLIELAYSEIFGFGPLDPLVDDPEVTTITLEGERVSVRRGHGELEPLDHIFEDRAHMKDVIGRLLQRADASLAEDDPLIEVGTRAENGRFMSMSLAAPPITFELSLDIRLHPQQAPTLASLQERGMFDDKTQAALKAIMASPHGVLIVGQPESGKTTLLSALLGHLVGPAEALAVERTGELHLPAGMQQVVAKWAEAASDAGTTFGEQVQQHHDQGYTALALDEVRADEPHTIAPLLAMEHPPRMLWSMRGTPAPQRLRSALDMLARRADMANGDTLSRNLFDRLPFVISLRRLDGGLQVRNVGEWTRDEAGHLQYQPLINRQDGQLQLAGNAPARRLPGLDDTFWQGS